MEAQLSAIFSLVESIIEILSMACCLWYFVSYIRRKNRPIQLSFILILLISDFIFNLNLFLQNLFPEFAWNFLTAQILTTCFAMMFSIIWATTISYLVYRSFLEYDFQPEKVIWKALTIVIIFILSLLSGLTFFGHLDQHCGNILFTVLALSIIGTNYFYYKSIRFASQYMDYEPQSTKKYINSMRYYCFAQTLTYLPYITAFFLRPYLPFSLSLDTFNSITSITNSFGSLAGCITVLLFIINGPMGYDKSKLEPIIENEIIGGSFS